MDQDQNIICSKSLCKKTLMLRGGRPAKVAKDQVVPDVDAYEVGRVEGGAVPPMPRHLGQKEVRREE